VHVARRRRADTPVSLKLEVKQAAWGSDAQIRPAAMGRDAALYTVQTD